MPFITSKKVLDVEIQLIHKPEAVEPFIVAMAGDDREFATFRNIEDATVYYNAYDTQVVLKYKEIVEMEKAVNYQCQLLKNMMIEKVIEAARLSAPAVASTST